MEENTNPQATLDELQPNEAIPQQNEQIAESTVSTTDTSAEALTDNNVPEPTTDESNNDYASLNREELLEALKSLMTEEVQLIKGRAQALRHRFNDLNQQQQKATFDQFLADGGNKDDYQAENDTIASHFYALYDQYRTRRQKYIEELEAKKGANLEAKLSLIDELKTLVDSNDEQVRTTMDKFNDIQERWKLIGEVPREKMNDLWQSYHFQIEQFFAKLKINRELRELDLKRNLDQKISLCERAEELLVEPSVTKAFKALQDFRAQWKETGPVPNEQNEEIWQRFQSAAQRIDDRRKEYYEQRKAEQDSNLLAKQALIEKATELTTDTPQTVRRWNEVSAELDELLKMWKTIGSVPREANEEIWSKFKGMIDRHYADKKEYFATLRDEQDGNYQKKVELCLKAEAIAKRDDWKKATEELLDLQKQWKEIGAVSRKQSDKVWHRFRSACDEFFAKKSEFFQDRRSSESENLVKKQTILDELKAHVFGDNREENLSVIKDFQRRWTEAGHVPIADKDRLQKEFRGLIDNIFEQLKISAREAEASAYRDRLRSMGNEASRFVRDERQSLIDKIEKLRSDINLWENNLGFLASSKQADLLKQEFEKKMQGARQQIALMQAKLRIINEESKKDEPRENVQQA